VRVSQIVVVASLLNLSCPQALAEAAGAPSTPPSATQSEPRAAPPPVLPEKAEANDNCRADAEVTRQTDALFEKARAAYEVSDKDESILWISRAYEVSKCEEYLFIIAELNREQGYSCAADRAYRQYLQELPNGRNAAAARQFAEELAGACQPSAAAASEPVQPTVTLLPEQASAAQGLRPSEPARSAPSSSSSSAWTPSRIVGWASLGAGLVTGAAAVYYVTVEHRAENDLEALWQSRVAGQTSPESWQANSSSLESKGMRAERTARILGISAGVLAVGGALLVIWGPQRERPTTAERIAERVELQLGPRGAHAGYTVHF